MSNEYFALDANVAALAQAFGEDMGDVKRRILKDATTFPTRTEMVAALPSLSDSPDGRIVFANGEGYMRDRDSSAIPDMPGWKRWEPIPGVVNASDIVSYGEQSPNPAKQAQARQNLGLGTASTHSEDDFATSEQGEKADAAVSYEEQTASDVQKLQAIDNLGLSSPLKSIAEMVALPTQKLLDGVSVVVSSYHEGNGRGGGTFVFSRTSSATPDGGKVFAASGGGRWLRVGDPQLFKVDDYGARSRSGVNDAPAFQLAIDAAGASGERATVRLSAGATYRINDELDFSSWSGRGETRFAFEGEGAGSTARIYVGLRGCTKKLFKFGDASARVAFRDFYVGSINFSRSDKASYDQRKDLPIIFWMPYCGQGTRWERVDTHWAATSVLMAGRVFNVTVIDCNWYAAGWQPNYRWIPDTTRFSTSGTTLTSNEAIFEPGDVGQMFFLASGGPAPDNINGHQAKITSFVSSTEVTIDVAPHFDVTNIRGSFDILKGSINNGSRNVNTQSPHELTTDDIGRYVYIDRAGPDRTVLATIVTEITSPTQFRVETAAESSVGSAAIWTAASVVLGDIPNVASSLLNDFKTDGLRIENYYGAAVMSLKGVHLFFQNYKTHGVDAAYNNFAHASSQLVVSETRNVFMDGAHIEHACAGEDLGHIVVRKGSVFLDNLSFGPVKSNSYIIDAVMGQEKDFVRLGPSQIATDLRSLKGVARVRGIVGVSDSLARKLYSESPNVVGTIEAYKDVPSSKAYEAGVFTSDKEGLTLLNGSAVFIPAIHSSGMLVFSTIQTTVWGTVYYRCTSNPATRAGGVGDNVEVTYGPLDGSTGTAGKFTVSADTDGIYLENRTGSGFTVRLANLS